MGQTTTKGKVKDKMGIHKEYTVSNKIGHNSKNSIVINNNNNNKNPINHDFDDDALSENVLDEEDQNKEDNNNEDDDDDNGYVTSHEDDGEGKVDARNDVANAKEYELDEENQSIETCSANGSNTSSSRSGNSSTNINTNIGSSTSGNYTSYSSISSRSLNQDKVLKMVDNEIKAKLINNISRSIQSLPPSFYQQNWLEPDVSELRVRGETYLDDGIKVPSHQPLFRLVAFDVFDTTKQGRIDNIASHPKNRVAIAHNNGENNFTFVLNFQVPGPPHYSCVVYLIPRDEQIKALMEHALTGKAVDTQYLKYPNEFPSGFFSLFESFFAGTDDKIRNERFKLVPRIIEGPWVVRQAVGSKPACIGTKLKQRYYRAQHYFELDIDIGSSVVAWQATKLAANKAKMLTIDMAFVLQGNSKDELQEETLGIIRVHQLHFPDAFPFDD